MSVDISSTKEQQRQADALIENVNREARKAMKARGRHAVLTPASNVQVVKPRFLYKDFIPSETQTLLAGRAGENKTTLTNSIGAKATRGLLPGDMHGKPINVAFSAFEDPKSIQVARLKAAGADMRHICFIDMADSFDGVEVDDGMTIPDDLPQIEELLKTNEIGLWVIDPITSAISGDTNKRDDVRRALDPLAALAQRLHIPILEVLHFNKGGGFASDKISGSHAWRDAAKSVLLVAKDEDNGGVVLTVDKSNYSIAVGSSWMFTVSSVDITDVNGETVSVPVAGELTPTDTNVGEIINRQQNQDDQADQSQDPGEVVDWLVSYLQDGPAPFKQIMGDARGEGYSKYQIQHAQQRATDPAIESVPDPSYTGRGQRRVWRLSNTSQHSPHPQMASNGYKSKTQSGVGLSISSQLLATQNMTPTASNSVHASRSTVTTNDHKSKTQAAVGLTNSGHLWSSGSTESTTTNPRPLDLARFDAPQRDGLIANWVKQLDRDGPEAIDHTLARMTPESLELLNQRGGVLKSATDREYERRSRQLAPTA